MSNLLAYVIPAPFDFSVIFSNFLSEWYYYFIALVFTAIVIFVVLFLLKKRARNSLNKTQKLVYTAVFAALAFVANFLTIPISQALQISLVALVGFVSGYILGAGGGFTALFVGDLICAIIKPTGVYSPIINIGTALWGFIPGLIFSVLPFNDYIKTAISFVLCFIFNSFLVNTFGISLMYGISFDKLLYALPIKLLVVAINAALSYSLLVILPRILPKDKFNFGKNKAKIKNAGELDNAKTNDNNNA